jgi:hypothetical protein
MGKSAGRWAQGEKVSVVCYEVWGKGNYQGATGKGISCFGLQIFQEKESE